MLIALVADLLSTGQPVRFAASGDSMEPTLAHGDALIVHPLAATELEVGMVALVRAGERVLAHRVVALPRAPDGSLTAIVVRGDACAAADAPLKPGALLGRVTARVRAGREYALGRTPERAGPAAWWRAVKRRLASK